MIPAGSRPARRTAALKGALEPRSADTIALALLGATIASAAAMRGVLSPLQEAARTELKLNDVQMGLVQGLSLAIPILLLSIPLGRSVDRGNRARLLVALSAIWTAGVFLTAFAEGFTSLFLARTLAGLGAGCAIPVAISIAADVSPPETRGRSLILLALGTAVGGALAFAAGGWLFGVLTMPGALHVLNLSPWRGVNVLFGAVSLAVTVLLLRLREPERHEFGAAPNAALPAVLRELWTYRVILLPLLVGQIGVVMADTAAQIWAAPLLTRRFGLQPGDYAGWMGLVVLVPGILGAVFGGVAADIGRRRRLPGGVLVGAALASVLALPAALFSLAGDVTTFALLLFCGAVTGVVTSTALALEIPNELRGVCLSGFVVGGAVVGFGVAPLLVTLVIQAMGSGGDLGAGLAITGLAVNLVSCGGFWLAARKIKPAWTIAAEGVV